MDHYTEIRRLTIVALFSDDKLYEQLVLKGGNALNVVHGLSPRTSIDIDFSLEEDFEDLEDTRQRIFKALRERFDAADYLVFDEQFQAKPRLDGPDERPWWGGYQLRFKLLPKEKQANLTRGVHKMRINAITVAPSQKRTFVVDISKFEYTAGKAQKELDFYPIYVYTPAMVAVEKLRAICQQMPDYEFRGARSARARDFFDIHLVLEREGIDLATPEHLDLIRNIFKVKRGPLSLLQKVETEREFHRPDWPAVEAATAEPLREFDYYFDFVVQQVQRLEILWEE